MRRAIGAAILAAALSQPALAGGSFEAVEVRSIFSEGGSSYELTVVPLDKANTDPYLKGCEIFVVIGNYSRFHSWLHFPSEVTLAGHQSALVYLRQAHEKRVPINFGWIGPGFESIDPRNRCMVRSRALQVISENGKTAVVSYFGAV
jgi:hypothetical protein